MSASPPLLERYRELLAEPDDERFPISLGEGSTPLVHARRLGEELGLDRLFLKFEGTNPTGSFKDRGMVLAVNRAVERGATAVVCASTGNTSASAAAYAAAAGLAVPRGASRRQGGPRQAGPGGGGRGAAGHGRRQLRRSTGRGARSWARRGPWRSSTRSTRTASPGQQTVAFEIVDALGECARLPSRCRSATPATSPPTGPASAGTPRPASRHRGGRG